MNERIKKLLNEYNEALCDEGIRAAEHPDMGETQEAPWEYRLEHVRWMILMMLGHPRKFSDRKLNRWLGFVQASLWWNGNRRIDQLRDETRPLYDDEEDAS